MKKILTLLLMLVFSSGCIARTLQKIQDPFTKMAKEVAFSTLADSLYSENTFTHFVSATAWVKKNITYEADKLIDMPAHWLRTLYTLRGDCDDSAYLLMRLMWEKGIRTTLFTVWSPGGGHTVCMLKYNGKYYHGGNWGLKGPFKTEELVAKSIFIDYNKIVKRDEELRNIK